MDITFGTDNIIMEAFVGSLGNECILHDGTKEILWEQTILGNDNK